MRSCTILLTFFLLFGIVSKAEANDSYHIDEQEFEELFASSEQSSDLLGYDNTLNTLALKDQVRYKSPDIAFVLAWFFGSLGVHRFYLGTSVVTGLAYILLSVDVVFSPLSTR